MLRVRAHKWLLLTRRGGERSLVSPQLRLQLGLLLLAAVMVGVAGGESRVGPNAASQERCPVGGIASTCCFEQCGHEAPRRGAARQVRPVQCASLPRFQFQAEAFPHCV